MEGVKTAGCGAHCCACCACCWTCGELPWLAPQWEGLAAAAVCAGLCGTGACAPV